MKQGWEIKKLKDVCERITDGTHQTPKYFESGYMFLSSRNVTSAKINWDDIKYIDETQHLEMQKRVSPRKGDILLAKNGTTGIAAIVDREVEFDIYVSLALLRSKGGILPEFLLYFVNSPIAKTQFNKRLKGIGVPNLHLEEIREVEISFPKSLPEQQRIVSILDECFAAIDQAKANAEQNLKNARELFESFLQGVFENEGWDTKTFDEVCEISSKLIDPRKSEYQNLIHVGAGNIESMTGVLSDLKTAKEDNLISGKFLFDETMVLYSKIRPYLVKVVSCNFKGLCSADIYPLKPNEKVITKNYLYHLLLTKQFTEYAILGSQRAGMPKVNRDHLFAYRFKLPPLEMQQFIVRQLDVLRAETQKLEEVYRQKITSLEELKKSILKKAFAGELPLGTIPEHVEPVSQKTE